MWDTAKLGDLLSIKHGFAFEGEFFEESGEYVLLTPGNISLTGGLKITGKEKSYSGQFPKSFVFEKGDLVVVMTDLIQDAPILGGAFQIPESGKFLHNQRLGLVSVNKLADKNFLYYVLNSEMYRGQVRGSATGSTVRHTAPERIYQCKFPLPPLPLQRRIAMVLGRYDALLENYKQQVAALEGLAQEVYQEWFVRGRCPGAEAGPEGELPAGWRAGKLFDIATIIYGFPFDSSFFNEEKDGTPVVRIRDVVDSITKTYTPEEAADKYVLQNGDIIVGMDGEFHINKWTGGRAYLNQRVLRASPRENIPRYFLLFAIRPPIEFLNSIIVGTTVAHLGDADLRRVEVIVPDAESLVKFGKLTDPIYDKVLNLHQQISTLRATRDALLPRLLSGQLTVHAAEATLAD